MVTKKYFKQKICEAKEKMSKDAHTTAATLFLVVNLVTSQTAIF